jgi:AcrR family transcriptional regulator
MGHRHSREELLDAATDFVLEHGLAQLTFGRLASQIGIADRTIVYYFATKEKLIEDVLFSLGFRLMGLLDKAFGPDPLPPDELLRRAWPVLATPRSDKMFAVLFAASGQATAGLEPFVSVVRVLMNAWIDWMTPKVQSVDPHSDALRAVVLVDGLMMVRLTVGPRAATQAARTLGIVD